jgi:AbrB family looped-hinge helix DNA binding protein
VLVVEYGCGGSGNANTLRSFAGGTIGHSITGRSNTMRITSKGQVTIPQEIRERFGLLPETEVEFRVEGNAVRLVKVQARRGRGRGSAAVERLRGTANVSLSTDEILALTRR